jgi:hypothetical protein
MNWVLITEALHFDGGEGEKGREEKGAPMEVERKEMRTASLVHE